MMTFLEKVKRKYIAITANSDYYYTCFAFDGIDPEELHCTHKFLGKQSSEDLQKIVDILDSYFKKKPFKPIAAKFDTEDFFHHPGWPAQRVLRTKTDLNKLLPDLRSALAPFRKDDYPTYKPHVTTDEVVVDKPMTRYCLLKDEKIIKEY